MSLFASRKFKRGFLKSVNLALVLSMMLSLVPAAPAHAADQRTNADCVRAEDGFDIFLPFITGAQDAVASVADAFQAPQAAPRTITWEAGKTYSYDYRAEINNTGSKRDAEGNTESSSNKTVVEAVAELSITSVKDDGTFVGQVVLMDPFVCSADESNEEIVDNAEFTAELQKPIIFEQTPAGVVTSIQTPADARPTVANIQKGVVNTLQMTLRADSDSYSAQETGGQGIYNVAYTLTEEGDNLKINKTYNQDSYTELNKDGDETNSLTMSTDVNATLDGDKGIITQITGSETIQTGDGIEDPDGSNQGFDGTTAWTKIASETSLTFKSVSDTPAVRSAALSAVYVDGDLKADFGDQDQYENVAAIDLETVDLNAEIDALVAAPDNPDVFLRVMDLVAADEGNVVIDTVKAKLDANASNEAASNALIDVLAMAGTPYAQSILAGIVDSTAQVGAASISATLSITTEEHALISLVLVDSPTMTTVNAVKNVSQGSGDLKGTAVSVLGATIDKLGDSDAQMADTLTNDLIGSLNSAGSEEEVELYLGALGNTGEDIPVGEITKFISDTLTLGGGEVLTETLGLQFAAYSALGRIPGQEAEDVLVAALNDGDELLGTRLTIFDMLSERDDLSSLGQAALQQNASLGDLGTEGVSAADANAPDYRASKSWNKRFGNGRLGLELPGRFTVMTPNHYNGIYLYAQQKADGLVWNRRINIADGRMALWRNTSTSYKFGAYLDLLNYRIRRKYERQFTCAWNRSGNLWSGNYTSRFNYRIPVLAIITVGVEVRLGAHARLDWSVGANVCNPADLTAFGSITPRAYATASADAYVSLVVVRGGVGVTARIMDTRFQLTLTGAFVSGNPRICVTIRIITQALSGRVYAFADRRSITWSGIKWKRIFTGNLATFGTPSRTYTIWQRCWP